MLVLTPFALSFVTLHGVFFAFSGTILLTRCHSASSMFSVVFVFQKSYTGNILRIGRNKCRTSYFYRSFTKTKDETEGGQGPASPPGCAHLWWDRLVHLLTLPLCLQSPLDGKNLGDGSLFLETYCKLPPLLKRDWEDPGALSGTLPERGIHARGLLHHHGRLQSDVWVVYLVLRAHSSS
jgi:hypothetical protein